MNAGEIIALITAACGIGGLVFTALRYNRDSTSTAVATQSQIVHDMKVLNDELQASRDQLRSEVDRLRGEIDRLNLELQILRNHE